MKRFLVFISLHLFLFLLIIAYQAQANDDDWNVVTSDEFIVTTKPGEVIWGDKLSLVIRKNDCARMNIVFSFSTKKEFLPSLKEIALNTRSFFKCNAQPPSIA